MGSCLSCSHTELEESINTEPIVTTNNTQSKPTVGNTNDAPVALGDLLTWYNDIDSKRQAHINNLLNVVPNTIELLLNSDYEKDLYNIYKETRILIKLRYDEYKHMEQHFNSIDTIVVQIEQQIQNNIYNSISLAKTSPIILIDTLKICEIEDNDYNNKTLYHSCEDWTKWRDPTRRSMCSLPDEKTDTSIMHNIAKDSMQSKVKSEIEAYVLKTIETLTFYPETEIKKCLLGIDDIISDLNYINDKTVEIFSKHYSYDIVNYFTETYLKCLGPLLLMQLDDENIKISDKLFILSWINSFKPNILNFIGNNICMTHRTKIIDSLNDQYKLILNSYVNKMTNTLSQWVANIMKNESITRDYFIVNEIPRLHSIQDLLTLLNERINIIMNGNGQYKLASDTFIKVMNIQLNSVSTFADLFLDYILKNMSTFKDEYFFALVNSSYAVTVKLQTHLDRILQNNLGNNKAHNTIMENSFDSVIFKFSNIAKKCAVQIGENIVKNNIKIGECFGMKDFSVGFITSKISILSSQCNIIKKRIEEKHFFNETIKSIIDVLTKEYIHSVPTLSKSKLKARDICKLMEKDAKLLNEYFDSFDDCIQKYWSNKNKIFNGMAGAFIVEDGFIDEMIKPLMEYECGDKVIKFIKMKRRKNPLLSAAGKLKLKFSNSRNSKNKGHDS